MKNFLPLFLLQALLTTGWSAVSYRPSRIMPPMVAREFRGVWIATVANIDWPSKPGLSTAEQKQELLAILDRAVRLKLNAVVFQVRPACDALYPSTIEPWSEYLTGIMGRPPAPFYDPLEFAIQEAHQRGLELHAWFNPYRALHFSHKFQIAPNHVSRTHPELVRKYGQYLWLDPGEPAVQEYSLRVVMDVVKRYDLDGVQFDDYFYPSEKDPAGNDLEFPDEPSWAKRDRTHPVSRDDWRRENVNRFIQRVYQSIKTTKPWVKFGISPFGIWRPGQPPQITGTDAYAKFYADSRKWLANGWVDYLSPQLYWTMGAREQSFPVLLNWWTAQNPKGRHLWPGLAAARAGEWKAEELPNQIRFLRKQSGASGYILYSAGSLARNPSLAAALEHLNPEPALPPASPWLGTGPRQPPAATASVQRENLRLKLQPPAGVTLRWWLIQTQSGGRWSTEILPASAPGKDFKNPFPEIIAASGLDRLGNETGTSVLEKRITRTIKSPHEEEKNRR